MTMRANLSRRVHFAATDIRGINSVVADVAAALKISFGNHHRHRFSTEHFKKTAPEYLESATVQNVERGKLRVARTITKENDRRAAWRCTALQFPKKAEQLAACGKVSLRKLKLLLSTDMTTVFMS